MDIGYWYFIGTIYLLLLTAQDLRNNMIVDDRKNYFMMGLTISLISHIDRPLWLILATLGIMLGLRYVLGRLDLFGDADLSTFLWMFTGYALLNPVFLGIFALYLAALTGLYNLIMKIGKLKAAPYYPVLLAAFASFNYLLSTSL